MILSSIPSIPASSGPTITALNRRLATDSYDSIYSTIYSDIKTGPWIAGGAALKLYQGLPLDNSDIDIFVRDFDQFIVVLHKLSKISSSITAITDNAVTLCISPIDKEPNQVQIIKRYYESANDVIDSFDLTVCQVVTDGREFKFGDTTIDDIKSKQLRRNPTSQFNLTMMRISKYLIYGYHISDELQLLIETNSDILHAGNHDQLY